MFRRLVVCSMKNFADIDSVLGLRGHCVVSSHDKDWGVILQEFRFVSGTVENSCNSQLRNGTMIFLSEFICYKRSNLCWSIKCKWGPHQTVFVRFYLQLRLAWALPVPVLPLLVSLWSNEFGLVMSRENVNKQIFLCYMFGFIATSTRFFM